MIAFTQFLLPNGQRRTVYVERSKEVEALAKKIAEAGYVFECEVLTTGHVHLTISNEINDWASEVVSNDAAVPEAVDRMIKNFDIEEAKQRQAEFEHDEW